MAEEYRRLQRQRARLGMVENRYYRDGRITEKEQRKLSKKYSKYNRKYRRAVRH